MARFYPSEVERECFEKGIRRGCFARCFGAFFQLTCAAALPWTSSAMAVASLSETAKRS
jgi:hypothetical protein